MVRVKVKKFRSWRLVFAVISHRNYCRNRIWQKKEFGIELYKLVYVRFPLKLFVETEFGTVFGRPFVKRFAQCYRTVVCLSVCLSCRVLSCSVCDVGVLWPNGLTDQDETWHAGRPRLWPHCVT